MCERERERESKLRRGCDFEVIESGGVGEKKKEKEELWELRCRAVVETQVKMRT